MECTGHMNLYKCLDVTCNAHFEKPNTVLTRCGKKIKTCPVCGSEDIFDVINEVKVNTQFQTSKINPYSF